MHIDWYWECPTCRNRFADDGTRILTHDANCKCPGMPAGFRRARDLDLLRRAASGFGGDPEQAQAVLRIALSLAGEQPEVKYAAVIAKVNTLEQALQVLHTKDKVGEQREILRAMIRAMVAAYTALCREAKSDDPKPSEFFPS